MRDGEADVGADIDCSSDLAGDTESATSLSSEAAVYAVAVPAQVCAWCRRAAALLQPLPRGGLFVQLCPVCFYIQSSLDLWNASGPAAPDGERLLISVEAEDIVLAATRGLYEILRANTAAVPDDG
jgi:hypothetical protein